MIDSATFIEQRQERWAFDRARDVKWPSCFPRVQDNLFLRHLHPHTAKEFDDGDGSECQDGRNRPAKMRALVSSSALAVNFFDAWRETDKDALSRALGLPAGIASLSFEFKTRNYPVRPRSPNLDLLLRLADGQQVAVESKFCEPYRSRDGSGGLSMRYFRPEASLWSAAGLVAAQRVADRFRPEWIHLDVPQLLKHMLGIANDSDSRGALMYLWFDTGQPDAQMHRREIERFGELVAKDRVAFVAVTYQEAFAKVTPGDQPVAEWHDYMRERYFETAA